MNHRFKELRKKLNMTQKEMGNVLGILNSTISDIEKGKANLTDRNIALICEKLSVNEEWIRYGTGDMFTPKLPEDEFSRLLSEIEESNDENFKIFIKMYVQLDEKSRRILLDLARSLLENQKK